jgi:yecA family protein
VAQKSDNYEALEERLRAANAGSGAAEAHGLLCGAVTAGGRSEPDLWLEHLLGADNTLSAAARQCRELLDGLQNDILGEFNDESFGFDVMLPADNAPLSVRTRALGEWCEGFLYGLALGGVRQGAATTGMVEEVMKDFYDISHAGFVTEAPTEDDEVAYTEIVEYLRISVLLLYQELQAVPVSSRLQ